MIKSKDDPNYVFDEYKGYTIASHKNNVVEESIDNLIIVYPPKEFPNHGFIVGLDDSKLSGPKEAIPHNMEDAKAYIDWVVKLGEERAGKVKSEIPKPQPRRGRKM